MAVNLAYRVSSDFFTRVVMSIEEICADFAVSNLPTYRPAGAGLPFLAMFNSMINRS
jgi:hypothetical protein